MDKRNYRESLEKDRQEIITDKSSTLSRRIQRQSGKKKSEKGRNLLLPSLFFIFILIPVAILIFVAFIYEPDDTLTGEENENQVSVENVSPPSETSVIVPEEAEEDIAGETEEAAEEEPEENNSSTEEKTEEPAEETVTETPEENEQPVEQETPVTTAPEEPEEPESSDTGSAKTVVVQENETLYRIAVNNYGASGAGAAVEKIKQANGLSSNEIYAGQTLILP